MALHMHRSIEVSTFLQPSPEIWIRMMNRIQSTVWTMEYNTYSIHSSTAAGEQSTWILQWLLYSLYMSYSIFINPNHKEQTPIMFTQALCAKLLGHNNNHNNNSVYPGERGREVPAPHSRKIPHYHTTSWSACKSYISSIIPIPVDPSAAAPGDRADDIKWILKTIIAMVNTSIMRKMRPVIYIVLAGSNSVLS